MAEPINALFGSAQASDLKLLTQKEKMETYASIRPFVQSLCQDEKISGLALMDLVVGVLHNAFPTFFWTGFYRRVSESTLEVGPSQGTLGCSHIDFGRGVCGTVAETEITKIVDDVHADPNHIACDGASQSEIVLPLFVEGQLVAVLDVDSSLKSAFDTVDQTELEAVLGEVGQALEGRDLTGLVWQSA